MPRSRESIESDPAIIKGKMNGLPEPIGWPFIDGAVGVFRMLFTLKVQGSNVISLLYLLYLINLLAPEIYI